MNQCRIVIIGSAAIGKTAFVIQFIQGFFVDEYDPTIEDSYRKQVMIDNETFLLEVLDTAGQEQYSVADQYMRVGDGFVMAYSITDRKSFTQLPTYRQKILDAKEALVCPMVLGHERQVATEEGNELGKSWDVPFFEASALARINVEPAFFAVAREVRKTTSVNTPRGSRRGSGCALL